MNKRKPKMIEIHCNRCCIHNTKLLPRYTLDDPMYTLVCRFGSTCQPLSKGGKFTNRILNLAIICHFIPHLYTVMVSMFNKKK